MRPANKTAMIAVDAKCDTRLVAPLSSSEPWLEEPEVESVVLDFGTAILFTWQSFEAQRQVFPIGSHQVVLERKKKRGYLDF